jgi:hypothetical protein
MKISVLAVPWYRREHYDRILAVMEDGHLLPASFDEWLERAEQLLKQAAHQGVIPVKAHVDPEPFVDWCRERNLRLDSNSRSQFANTVAAAMYQDGRA